MVKRKIVVVLNSSSYDQFMFDFRWHDNENDFWFICISKLGSRSSREIEQWHTNWNLKLKKWAVEAAETFY